MVGMTFHREVVMSLGMILYVKLQRLISQKCLKLIACFTLEINTIKNLFICYAILSF